MKSIFTLLIITLSINTFSQKLVKTYWDYYNTKIQSEYYTDVYGTKNGLYKGYSVHGGVLIQGLYKDNAPIGKWIENYLNGKLHYIKIHNTPGNILQEVNDGKVFCYYEDGKTLKFERNFKNHELDGIYRIYNENGVLIEDDLYIQGKSENKRIESEKVKRIKEIQEKKNAEEYEKIIQEADKEFLEKNYKKALELYYNASTLVGNDKLRQIADSNHRQHELFIKKIKLQEDSLIENFKRLTSDFKIKIIKSYNKNNYTTYEKKPINSSSNCDCITPWNIEQQNNWGFDWSTFTENSIKCFDINKEFYEPFQIMISKSFFNYRITLTNDISNKSSTSILHSNNIYIYTYEQDSLIENIKFAKNNYELAKTVKSQYYKVIDKKDQIINLNNQNKRKKLFKKYAIVYNELLTKYNKTLELSESINYLTRINTISDKVIFYYSQDTKELVKKLKDAETAEQIESILIGKQ